MGVVFCGGVHGGGVPWGASLEGWGGVFDGEGGPVTMAASHPQCHRRSTLPCATASCELGLRPLQDLIYFF